MVGGARIMDPMLSKLCELWELDVTDESSLSHLLPSTKYAWGNEAVSPPPDFSLCYTNVLQAPPSESPGFDGRFCGLCESTNRDDANWCTECGSAIVGTTALSEKLSLQCDSRSDTGVSPSCSPDICPQLLNDIVDLSVTASPESESFHLPETFTLLRGEASIENQQCLSVNYVNVCDPVIHGELLTINEQTNSVTKPVVRSLTSASQQSNVRQIDSNAVRVKNSSPLVPQNNYQRHWNTSGVHMWRKPSSIQKSNQQHQTLLNDLPGGCANPVKQPPTLHRNNSLIPLIDLSTIQRDLGLTTECISTRTSFSIDNVRMNSYENFCGCVMFACLQQVPLHDVVNLLFLPDEIILIVLSNLSHRDLANCMLVCKRLFHIASDATLCEFTGI